VEYTSVISALRQPREDQDDIASLETQRDPVSKNKKQNNKKDHCLRR
jgi:hypothetical protein